MTRCLDGWQPAAGAEASWALGLLERVEVDEPHHQPGAGSPGERRGSLGPSWGGGAGAPARRSKGYALKMKGRRVWEEEGRQKSGATGEGGGGGGRHLGEHLALTGRRLAVREQACGFQPTLVMEKDWKKGSPSFLQLLTYGASHKGASSLGSTQQHRGREVGNVCRDKHDGGQGAKFRGAGADGRVQGQGIKLSLRQCGRVGLTAGQPCLGVPREAGQRSPGVRAWEPRWGQGRPDQQLWRAQSLAAAGHGGILVGGWIREAAKLAPASCRVGEGGWGAGERV